MSLLVIIYLCAALVWFGVWFRSGIVVPAPWLLWATVGLIGVEAICGYQVFTLQAGPLPLTLERIGLGVLFVLAFLTALRQRFESVRWDFVDGVVIAWFAVLSLSVLLTDYQYRNNTPLSRLLFLNAMPMAAYFVLKHSGWQLRHLRVVGIGVVLFGTYLALTAIAEWQQWHVFVFPKFILSTTEVAEFFGRGRGPLLNPIINGMLMSAAVAVLLTWWPTASWRGRGAIVVLVPVLGCGIVATMTRSVWLGMVAGCGVVVLTMVSPRQRMVLTALAILVALPLGFIAKETLSRFKRDQNVSVEDMAQSASLRPLFVRVAWEMFQDRPITGVGFGQYQKYKRPFHHIHNTELPLQRALPYFQHNVFLAYLVEMGLLGLLSLLVLLATLFWRGWQVATDQSGPHRARCLAAVALAVGTNYVVNGMFHDVSLIPVANFHCFLALGILGRVYHLSVTSAVAKILSTSEDTPLMDLGAETLIPA